MSRFQRLRQHLLHRLSTSGLLLGTLFFVASLTPSLNPRILVSQAVISGVCFSAGYGIGVLLRWTWNHLEIPFPRALSGAAFRRAVIWICALLALIGLWRGRDWQNLVHEIMHLPPVGYGKMLGIGVGAVITVALVLLIARGARLLARSLAGFAGRYVPRRVATLLGVVVTVVLLVGIVNGVIIRNIIDSLDASLAAVDARIPPELPPPTEPYRMGSPASLVAWNELGNQGRRYISAQPTAEEITAFTGRPAKTPMRVYVGLPARDTPEERAKLALEELLRVDGFSRKALVIITTTGTGWVDPGSMVGLEYLYHGDTASVAVQYSYLSSPLSLFVEPESGEITARALFREVYGHWRNLPKDQRPKLYLHGLSLGAFNSERSFDAFEVLGDPVDGALWVGPPYDAQQWRAATAARNAGSPAWLPLFRDGSFVRFMNQDGTTVPPDAPWGRVRVVYLQYASDAVTFFDPHSTFREPEWMKAPRGPDVSPAMHWYPVVSIVQTAFDMMLAGTAPMGFGHVFAPSDYTAGWLEVSGVDDWTPQEFSRLQAELDRRRAAQIAGDDPEDEHGGG